MRKYLLILAFCILPQISYAAISYDTSVAAPDVAGGTASVTFAYTVSGLNPVLIVGINNLSNVDDIGTTPPTYNSVTMTLLQKVHDSGSSRWDYVYYMLNPPTGVADNIVVTRVNTTSNLRVLAASYDGVSQINFPDNSKTATPSATPVKTTMASILSGCWYVIYGENNTAVTGAGTGTTFRTNDVHTSGMLGDSNAPLPGQTNISLSLTGNGSSFWGIILFSMAPAIPAIPIFAVRTSTIIRSSTIIQ